LSRRSLPLLFSALRPHRLLRHTNAVCTTLITHTHSSHLCRRPTGSASKGGGNGGADIHLMITGFRDGTVYKEITGFIK
jgi:hypothetical protein